MQIQELFWYMNERLKAQCFILWCLNSPIALVGFIQISVGGTDRTKWSQESKIFIHQCLVCLVLKNQRQTFSKCKFSSYVIGIFHLCAPSLLNKASKPYEMAFIWMKLLFLHIWVYIYIFLYFLFFFSFTVTDEPLANISIDSSIKVQFKIIKVICR